MYINITTDSKGNHSRPSWAQVKYGYSYYLDSSYMPCEQGRWYLLQDLKHFIQKSTQ